MLGVVWAFFVQTLFLSFKILITCICFQSTVSCVKRKKFVVQRTISNRPSHQVQKHHLHQVMPLIVSQFFVFKDNKNCLIIISKLSSTICNFSSWGRRGDQPCSTKRKMAKHVWNILQARHDIWIPCWSISNNPWHFDYSRPLGYVSIDGTYQLQICMHLNLVTTSMWNNI